MKYTKYSAVLLSVVLVLIYLPDEDNVMPVENATSHDWNPKSFWYYPWGRSITHKGVDVFAKEGTKVVARSRGLVIFSGYNGMGGKSVIILSNKYRLHYYAHLKSISVARYTYIPGGKKIGEVGNTGNAKGKPAHLHRLLQGNKHSNRSYREGKILKIKGVGLAVLIQAFYL